MKTTETIQLLKENEQDFEWYPTTDEMILAVFRKCRDISSVLDVGAGDGRVLIKLHELCKTRAHNSRESYNNYSAYLDKYAIEISIPHIENMPDDISIVGKDFRRQTLIDKKVDVVFCNPPYSEFEDWAVKIIKEANAKTVFLIIPERWKNSKLIESAIKQRNATSHVIWSGDFANAERQARAKVDIIQITISTAYSEWERAKDDPFDVWFDEYFAGFDKLKPIEDDEGNEIKEPEPFRTIVEGQNLIERLEKFYQAELNNLLNNYKTLSNLDAGLLNEIGVAVSKIKEALKQKIQGLKNKYWNELFNNLDKITSRLTHTSRKSIIEKMNAACNIDFSVDNAYAVVLWVIKNANKYINQQLIEVFKTLSEPECVKNYKSNLRTWEKDRWRYKNRENHTHYMLDYRIITSQWNAIMPKDTWSSYDYHNNLAKNCHDFINDIFTIANNLGFVNMANSKNRLWESNKEQEFNYNGKTLVKIRAFKNGNLHLKFNQDFIKTFNIEASRLLGWIKTPKEAADEMGININFAKKHFGTNLLFGITDGQKLLMAG